jgi:hypothetical protein
MSAHATPRSGCAGLERTTRARRSCRRAASGGARSRRPTCTTRGSWPRDVFGCDGGRGCGAVCTCRVLDRRDGEVDTDAGERGRRSELRRRARGAGARPRIGCGTRGFRTRRSVDVRWRASFWYTVWRIRPRGRCVRHESLPALGLGRCGSRRSSHVPTVPGVRRSNNPSPCPAALRGTGLERVRSRLLKSRGRDASYQ